MKSVRFSTAMVVIAGGFLLFAGCTMLEPAASRSKSGVLPVVAVTSFDNRSGFQGNWQLGDGMADLLVSELVQSKCFVVVEREHFDRLVSEIERQHDKLFRPEGKVETGRMKNAHYQVRGVINDFSQTGGGAVSLMIRSLLFGGRGYTARVSMILTIIEIESGTIVNSVQCTGTAHAREAYVEAKYSGVAFGGESFFKTPLGAATQEAIHEGLQGIIDEMPTTEWRPMIVSVDGKQIVLNGGRNRSMKVGQLYLVRRAAQPVTDPGTGDVLDYLPGPKVGTVRVVTVDKKLSFAEPVEGTGFERGQWLELIKPGEKAPAIRGN